MRISRFIAIPNLRKSIAEANETPERKVAFQRGLAIGVTVCLGFVYAVVITYIFNDAYDSLKIDPSLIVLPLFVLFTIVFLNLVFLQRSRFDDLVELEALKRSQKERREKRASES